MALIMASVPTDPELRMLRERKCLGINVNSSRKPEMPTNFNLNVR